MLPGNFVVVRNPFVMAPGGATSATGEAPILPTQMDRGSIDISLDFPAGAVFAGEEFVRLGNVGDFGAGGIKKQSLAAESK